MSKRSENFLKGFYDVLPLLLPVVPFGIIFGAIGVELGFGPYVTYATSIIIFSGASQIVFFQLLSNGCLLYTSPSPRDRQKSRMPSSA